MRALGFDDIQSLLINRSGLIQQALELFNEHGVEAAASDADVRQFVLSLIGTLPELVAELIAIAADEPDMAHKARRIPAPAQLELLMAVYEQTFVEPDAVGKFFGRLADLMTNIPRPSKTGSPVMGGPIQPGIGSHGSNASGETLPS